MGGLEALNHKAVYYAVRARFVGGVPSNLQSRAIGNILYLGRRGQWATIEKALLFRTIKAAESALHEKWNRLHNAGNKTVILSVVRA